MEKIEIRYVTTSFGRFTDVKRVQHHVAYASRMPGHLTHDEAIAQVRGEGFRYENT